ncbi:transcriptional regulator [Mediterraneibacter glycyrrhizinilyticus]|nr:helix-turn-helix transcriptional regulator [Mediterraneibacter glycyrrhizinilyticus]MBM6853214.1 transcriptional regulator [Mediterraneibacter glycyrrhizinilyticus]
MKQDTTLDLLIQIAHGLAEHFGPQCEIAIHDVTRDLSNTIVYIENGQVSGRTDGDGASNVVLEALNTPPEKLHDQIAYLTRTEDGRALKSSTLYIRDENGNLRYLFSVNYDIASLRAVDELIQGLITTHPLKKENPERESVPKIPHTVTELLDSLIEHAIAEIGKPVVMMTKEDKIRVVHYLNDAGAFLITKSGDRVASALGISKFTLYKYMESDAE